MTHCPFLTLLASCWLIAVVGGDSESSATSQEEATVQDATCPEEDLEPAESIHKPIPLGAILHAECEHLGSPIVRYTIGADGRVKELEFLRSSRCKKADDELRRCLAEWRYKAASCHGKPVAEDSVLTINWGYGPPPAGDTDYCPPYESTPDASETSDESQSSPLKLPVRAVPPSPVRATPVRARGS